MSSRLVSTVRGSEVVRVEAPDLSRGREAFKASRSMVAEEEMRFSAGARAKRACVGQR
jgi:hypothetical protein